MHGLRRLPGSPGGGTAMVPGCLKSESEERETWTAGSLRAALSWKSNFPRRAALEETSAVHVLRYIADRTFRSVGGPRQCDDTTQCRHCANVTCRDKNLIQLESLILAQSERWRQA